MNVRNLLIPLLCLGAVAFACGPRSHSEASLVSVNIAKPTTPVLAKQTKQAKTPHVAKVAPSFAVEVNGNTVRFALDVTNGTKKTVELTFPDGQTHDFAVLDANGREVYRWGATRMFTQSVQNKTIEGGSTLRISERATPPLPAGSCTAVATRRSSNCPLTERAAFDVR